MGRGRTARAVLAGGALAAALLGLTSEAGAQDRFNTRVGRVTNGPFYRVTAALRLNPLGLFGEGRFGFRTRLFDTPGASILLKNTYLAGGVSFTTSPAFVRPGIFVEFAPLAILNFQANFEHVWWYGNFQYMQSFPHVIGPRQAQDMGRRRRRRGRSRSPTRRSTATATWSATTPGAGFTSRLARRSRPRWANSPFAPTSAASATG